jgi:methenyltetrahydromethanopterin cyclohydrolase
MRELHGMELHCVSGGDWKVEFHGGVVDVTLEGDEDVQDMAGAVASIASSAYGAAVEATTDMFEWIANGWNYSAACSGGYWY